VAPAGVTRTAIPAIYAHRFGMAIGPENMLATARHAWRNLWVRCFELDVQLSRDGHPVIIHDETVDRIAPPEQVRMLLDTRVSRLDLAQLRALGIPTLDELFAEFVEGRAVKPHLRLERKTEHLSDAEVAEYDRIVSGRLLPHEGAPWLVTSSFDPRALDLARGSTPRLARAYLSDQLPDDYFQVARDLGCRYLDIGDGLRDTEDVSEAVYEGVARGFDVTGGWGCDTFEEVERWWLRDRELRRRSGGETGLSGLICNDPEYAVAVWRQLGDPGVDRERLALMSRADLLAATRPAPTIEPAG
jgi:glycerophosphoryl diester phosphodiesterase